MANAAQSVWPFVQRFLPGNFGLQPFISARAVPTIADTATTSVYTAVPRRLVKVIAANISGPTAALSNGGTVTAKLFKRTTSSASPADVGLTAATSIEAAVITGIGCFDWPITATDSQAVLQPGDVLRWDFVAASTMDTQPVLNVTVELNVLQ